MKPTLDTLRQELRKHARDWQSLQRRLRTSNSVSSVQLLQSQETALAGLVHRLETHYPNLRRADRTVETAQDLTTRVRDRREQLLAHHNRAARRKISPAFQRAFARLSEHMSTRVAGSFQSQSQLLLCEGQEWSAYSCYERLVDRGGYVHPRYWMVLGRTLVDGEASYSVTLSPQFNTPGRYSPDATGTTERALREALDGLLAQDGLARHKNPMIRLARGQNA